MLNLPRCTWCGTIAPPRKRQPPDRKTRCVTCGNELVVRAIEDLLDDRLHMMGDDDDGGAADGAAAEEPADDEDDSDAKKKKKKKAKPASGGGFMNYLIGNLIGRLIGAAVFLFTVSSCCICVCVLAMIFGSGTPFVGDWESKSTKVVMVNDIEEPRFEAIVNIQSGDSNGGTGTFTNEHKIVASFRWKNHDKDKKSVVFEMNNPTDKFWRDLKSPTTFEYDVTGNTLKLTSTGGPATVVEFSKIPVGAKDAGPAKKK